MKKTSGRREKWTVAILGVVCVALLVNLLRSPFVKAGAPRPVSPQAPSASPTPAGRGPSLSSYGDLERYDPEVRLELLNRLDGRTLPPLERNPFLYGVTQAEKAQQEKAAAQAQLPPPPPPPPPITVKALGYSDGADKVRRAYFADEEETYQVREGEVFAGRYKVLKITPMGATIEDQTSHQTAQLPFPE
jgi:hypothetical protein